MPSNIDKQFIENLQNFTESLENVVELMKQQSEKGDAVNKMLSALDGPKLSEISEDMKSILESNKRIDNRTKEILEEVKAARKQKEAGMFDKISNKENKHKIRDSIQTIILISGGVLALGMAFKIIGKVDFLSVISMSIAMLTLSHTFAKIAQIKDLSIKNVMFVGLAIVAMSAAITVSSFILRLFQPLDPIKMFSFIVVSSVIGIAARFIFKAVKDLSIKPKDLLKFLLLPIILPAIALSITLSSFVLNEMKTLDNPFGVLITSLTIGISMLAFLPAIYVLGKMKIKQLLMGALGAVVVSGAIMLSSWIISVGKYDGNFPSAKWALGVGLSLIMFTPAVLVLGFIAMTGIGALAILAGSGLVLVVAASIVGTSHVLSYGTYDSFPSAKWAAGVGLALLVFAPALLILGAIPLGKKLIKRGTEMMISVASTIVLVSYILSKGTFKGGPTVEWARGIGEALSVFKDAIGTGTKKAENLSQSMIKISQSMVYISHVLAQGDWDNGVIPSDWMKNIYTNYMIYNDLYRRISKGKKLELLIMNKVLKNISTSMVEMTHILNKGDWDNGRIPNEWMINISSNYISLTLLYEFISNKDIKLRKLGKTLTDIAQYMVEASKILSKGDFNTGPGDDWADGIARSMNAFVDSITGIDDNKLKSLKEFSSVIRHLGRSIKKLRESGIDKLERLTASVNIMSVIDDEKLRKSIQVIDENKDKLSNVLEQRSLIPGGDKQKSSIIDKFTKGSNDKMVDKQDEMIKKFDTVLEKFDQLLEYVIESKSPDDTGKKESTKR